MLLDGVVRKHGVRDGARGVQARRDPTVMSEVRRMRERDGREMDAGILVHLATYGDCTAWYPNSICKFFASAKIKIGSSTSAARTQALREYLRLSTYRAHGIRTSVYQGHCSSIRGVHRTFAKVNPNLHVVQPIATRSTCIDQAARRRTQITTIAHRIIWYGALPV
jgi:hypothetical protein